MTETGASEFEKTSTVMVETIDAALEITLLLAAEQPQSHYNTLRSPRTVGPLLSLYMRA